MNLKRASRFAILATTTGMALAAAGEGGQFDQALPPDTESPILESPMAQQSVLTADEIAGLIFMREEEKLALDIYNMFAKKWNLRPFLNIAASELTHTNMMKDLLVKYGIEDPAKDQLPGKFKNKELQKLYDALALEGAKSASAALRVGAKIEDVDIYDLDRLLKVTKAADVRAAYDFLNLGSRNHMRAFVRNLGRYNETFRPEKISQAAFDKIINSDNEHPGADVQKNSHAPVVIATASFYSAKTNLPINRASIYLQEEAKAAGFRVSGQHDLQASLKKEGKAVFPTLVIELCQPDVAEKALKMLPDFASAMPCRVALTESNGITTLSMVKPTALAKAVSDLAEAQAFAKSTEDDLIAILVKSLQRTPTLDEALFDVNLPYKVALFSSNQADPQTAISSITRTIGQWESISEHYSTADHVLAKDKNWKTMTQAVSAALKKSLTEANSGKLIEAHESLESVRKLWAAHRKPYNLKNFSDSLLAFHDSMEAAVELASKDTKIPVEGKWLADLNSTWLTAMNSSLPQLDPDQTAVRQKAFDEMSAILKRINEAAKAGSETEVRKEIKGIKSAFVKLYLQFG